MQFKDWLKREGKDGEFLLLSSPNQKAMQVKWAQGNMESVEEEFFHIQKHEEIDEIHGEWMNASQLVIAEGGWKDKQAIKGSAMIMLQCTSMHSTSKTKWVGVDPQSSRRVFLD